MKATSRMSAPYAAAISIIAVAAPGDEPQTAVVAGSTCQRVSSHPSAPLAAITAMTTVTKIGQPRAISPTIVGGMLRAIMQPMIACAIRTRRWGTRNPPPATATRIAAIIGPSKRAAGRRMASRPSPRKLERMTRITHCLPSVWRPNSWLACSLPPVLGGASISYSTGERLRTTWGHGLAVASLTCC